MTALNFFLINSLLNQKENIEKLSEEFSKSLASEKLAWKYFDNCINFSGLFF